MSNNNCGVVYKIKNRITGKVYIGITTKNTGFLGRYYCGGDSLSERVFNFYKNKTENCDGKGVNIHLYRSMQKYGFENFDVFPCIDVASSIAELKEKESFYIKKYNSTDPAYGYNFLSGGEGVMCVRDKIKTGLLSRASYGRKMVSLLIDNPCFIGDYIPMKVFLSNYNLIPKIIKLNKQSYKSCACCTLPLDKSSKRGMCNECMRVFKDNDYKYDNKLVKEVSSYLEHKITIEPNYGWGYIFESKINKYKKFIFPQSTPISICEIYNIRKLCNLSCVPEFVESSEKNIFNKAIVEIIYWMFLYTKSRADTSIRVDDMKILSKYGSQCHTYNKWKSLTSIEKIVEYLENIGVLIVYNGYLALSNDAYCKITLSSSANNIKLFKEFNIYSLFYESPCCDNKSALRLLRAGDDVFDKYCSLSKHLCPICGTIFNKKKGSNKIHKKCVECSKKGLSLCK